MRTMAKPMRGWTPSFADVGARAGDADEWRALERRAEDDRVAALVVRIRADADTFVDAVARRILETVQSYGTGEFVDRDELWQSVFDNVETVLLALGKQGPLSEDELAARRELGRLRARQGMPLEDIMRAFRVGYTALWEGLSSLAARLGEEYAEALLDRAAHVWATFDQVTSAVAEAYRTTWDSQHLDRRRRALALLTGLQRYPDNAEATEGVARSLGFDPHGTFACAVLSTAGRYPPAERDLLVIEQPDRFVVIAVVAGDPRAAEATFSGRLRRRASTNVGVGIMRQGLEGAQQSLTDAEWAHALARATDAPSVLYRESWLACLALRHYEQLDLLVASAVEALEEDEELAATLEAFLEADGNLTSAGRALYVHANTVSYRLRQFAVRAGIDVRTPTGMALVQVALIHAQVARRIAAGTG